MPKKPSYREKRESLKQKKRERSQESDTKLIASVEPSVCKPLVNPFKPYLNKKPRLPLDYNYRKYSFMWDFIETDLNGQWEWGEPRNWSDNEFESIVLYNMRVRKNNSWEQVCNETYNGRDGSRKNIYRESIPLDNMCNEAGCRWLDDDLRSQFEPARFRVGTNRRIWGFRYMHCYYVVWYERYHRIYPI